MEILELKNTVTKIKNPTYGLNIRMEGIKKSISELQDRTIEITQSEQQRENTLKKNKKASRICGTIKKRSSVCVIRVPEGAEKKVGAQKVCKEIMAKNFPNWHGPCPESLLRELYK